MLKDLWPHIVTEIPLPRLPLRLRGVPAVRRPSSARRPAPPDHLSELVCAYQQIGLLNDLDYMVGVMPPNIWQHVFGKSGWEIEFIGPETILDTGEVIVAGKMNLSRAILDNILRTTGLESRRLQLTPELRTIVGGAVLSEDLHKETA